MSNWNCICCNREISTPESVQRGFGPICYARKQREFEREAAETNDRVDLPFDPETMDILCRREGFEGGGWRNHFNIHQVYKHHSPTGMNWGYGGSGPADFALNILELFMRRRGEKPNRKIRHFDDGHVSELPVCAWTLVLYQEFKRDVIAGIDEKGGTISGSFINRWIDLKATPDNWRLIG
jgi:hypothetical protein